MEDISVKLDGKEYKVQVEEIGSKKLRVHFDGKSYDVETKNQSEQEIVDEVVSQNSGASGKDFIKAPLPGTVVAINTKVGAKVSDGDSVVKLVAMKMENDIIAEKNGVVKEIRVKKNQSVEKDEILIVLGSF
ncbi:MAG TPA: biotin/lipoyl-containing protein [Candidatus Nanoarchaeia archaeon]|nr:biotin/lipoyl-containing protein [Candidatus Nanoarchaeia archaeon]